MQPTAPLTSKEFWDVYWFQPTDLVTLINPLTTDYNFMVEMRHFVVRAGSQEQMPGTVANVYLSEMTRLLAQVEDKFQHLSDLNLMKEFYDRLIVDKKSLLQEADTRPAYLSQVPETMQGQSPETPPWQQPISVSVNNTSTPKQTGTTRDTLKETDLKETKEVKEFEHNGSKFKMVVNKRGGSMYYKDGKMISETEYAKTASML